MGGGGKEGLIEAGLINFPPLKRGGGGLVKEGSCLRGGLNKGFTVTAKCRYNERYKHL